MRGAELDTRLAYRLGSRTLPVLPLETLYGQDFRQWPELYSAVDQILKEEKVHAIAIDSVRRFQDGKKAQDVPKTILILSDVSLANQYESWQEAALKITNVLLEAKRPDILVEFIDVQAVHEPKVELIESMSDAFICSWVEIREYILDQIKDRSWLSIDLLDRTLGQYKEERKPTVCITAADAGDDVWWARILPTLRNRLPHGMDLDLFYSSDLSLAADEPGPAEEPPEVFTTMNSYDHEVEIGSSIGACSDRSGSLGTTMLLRTPDGEEIRCALTNHHIVAKNDIVAQAAPAGTFISPAHTLVKQGLAYVRSPSEKDDLRMQKLKEWELEVAIEKRNQHHYNPKIEAERVRRLQAAEDNVQKLRNKKPEDTILGTVYATSGYRSAFNDAYTSQEAAAWSRVTEGNEDLTKKINGKPLGWGLNWAIIKLQPLRDVTTHVPSPTHGVKMSHRATLGTYQTIQPHRAYNVVKYGRTSKWTTGTISKIGSLLKLRLPGDPISVVPAELDHAFKSIVLAYGVKSRSRSREFLSPGDSGSVVLLNQSEKKAIVVGLGFAANRVTMVSYMMPIDLVLKDIEKVTGCGVIEPVFGGECLGDLPDSP